MDDTGGTAVIAENLRKRYGDTIAIDDVNLRVEAGECVGILGVNGAGKTTLVEMIAGLRVPDGGRVRVLGLDPRRDRAKLRQVMGVQLQQAYLHNALTVEELVRLFRSFYPDPRPADEALELVGLTGQRRTRFDRLSGGQQQRLSVTLALIGRPRIAILDELTTGLDPRARRRMWEAIRRLRDENVTVLLVTHAMEEVERLCDRVALLDGGRLVLVDTPAGMVARVGAGDLDDAFVALTGRAPEGPEGAE